jgi:hypothetical protein
LATSIVKHGSGPPVRISSAPQNITLSPQNENVVRVAIGAGKRAVTWDQSLTLFTGAGAKTMQVSEVLGVSTRAGVAISPRGRVHVIGGGRYSYSDDGGVTWADPVTAPAGSDPLLIVGLDGCVRAFWKAGGTVQTAKQRVDRTWSTSISLGAGGDYDAVRTEDSIVALTSSPAVVYRFSGESSGRIASLGAADRVDLHYGSGELLAGMVRGGNKAVIARSFDGGSSWAECLVQRVGDSVRDVAVVPTEQGPYAVLWILDDGYFPSVLLSKAHWKPGEACGVWPELGQVDALGNAAFVDAPRLFAIGCPQISFRTASEVGAVFMAFTCVDDSGASDVFVSEMATSGFFSGPALGGARAGEGSPRDDYLGDLP